MAMTLLAAPSTTMSITCFSRGREGLQSLQDVGAKREGAAVLLVQLQGVIDAIQQILIAEGLLHKLKSALFHRLHGHWHIPVAGDKDHRQHRSHAI